MKQNRPINLDLRTLHFPVMAITSIMHRVSGIIIFILLPFMIYFLQLSLGSKESYLHMLELLDKSFYKLIVWGFLSALVYHFMAGVRHMIADYGYGETVGVAKKTARLLLTLTVMTTVLLGVWVW
ncbi:MAG: succinate dehydrogenase, cytochrome b556 subunit [Gammaproteobacteria bacterium]|nr:succinate dehydrogenase, cytochrome b556 subunit [Gammaproteobacteria bacterium]